MLFQKELAPGIYCLNCVRLIPQSNYLSHEAYCIRYIKLCTQCQSLFDVREQSSQPHWCPPYGDHEGGANSYQMSRCDMLDQSANMSQMNECHFCGAEMPSALSDTHQSSCFEAESSSKHHQSVLNEGQFNTPSQHSMLFQDCMDKFKRQRIDDDRIVTFTSEQLQADTELLINLFKKRKMQ